LAVAARLLIHTAQVDPDWQGSAEGRKLQGDNVDADRTSRNPAGNAGYADRAAAGNPARQPKSGSAAANA